MVILGDEYTLNKSPRLLFYRKQSETAEKKLGEVKMFLSVVITSTYSF